MYNVNIITVNNTFKFKIGDQLKCDILNDFNTKEFIKFKHYLTYYTIRCEHIVAIYYDKVNQEA